MSQQRLTLIRKHHEAGNVWTYTFTSTQPMSWTPGQSIYINLSHPDCDHRGPRRWFTIASAPHESAIRISTRLTDSSFKQALHDLAPGGELDLLDTPSGSFIWRDHPSPLVLIAQGIGITPFLSMIRHRHHHQLPIRAQLYFTNYHPIPFREELLRVSDEHPEFTVHFIDHPATPDYIARHHTVLSDSLIYISGPLSHLDFLMPPYNLSPRQINQDQFPNYPTNAY